MTKGGRLTISTSKRSLAPGNPQDLAEGDYVAIDVADTGDGMAPDVLARAFEPFFTTRDIGKGSGLGLAMVYGFVKQSGGHVGIASEPGRGTTVTLTLPRAPGEEAEPAA
jgi:signal transduction histidine kinase